MNQKSFIHLVNAVLLVGLWAFAILAYPQLPEQIPQHIGLGGEVTRWTSRDSGMWFLMPILTVTNLVVLYGLAFGMTSAAGMNVPQKKRLLALPPEAQAWALQPVRLFMLSLGTWLILVSALVQGLLYVTATGAAAARSALMAALLVLALAPLGGVWWLSRAVARRVDAAESAAARSGGASS